MPLCAVVRIVLLIAIIGIGLFFAQRSILNSYAPSQPIDISTQPAPVTFVRAFPNLILDRPIFLTFPPDGSNRIAVISQYGSIYMFPNDRAVEEPSEVLDIRKKVVYTDREPEEGMLGLAFHPKFRENRQFFVYYTTADHTNVLSRFTMLADDPNRADPASEQELFRTPKKPYWNHNAGTIIFGPENYLYIACGDGGPGNDPQGNGQSLQTVMGKILRIDVDHQDPGLNYAIPKDNPFAGVPEARGEIWAWVCGTSGEWPSIGKQTACGRPMWAKTRGRKSTSSSAAATMAGISAKDSSPLPPPANRPPLRHRRTSSVT